MRRLLVTLLVLSGCVPAQAAGTGSGPVRVQLSSVSGVRVVVRSAAGLVWRDPASRVALGATPAETAAVVEAGSGLRARWEGKAAGEAAGGRLRVEAADGTPLRLEAGRLQRVYAGAIEFSMAGSRLRVVNEAPLEEYVRGVMCAEVPASFHPEALKAMAVVIRTYAMATARKHGADAGICDGTDCQVYRGIARVPRAIDEAVAATAGVFALFDGRPIEALYSADCGGCTEASENGWRGAKALPYLRAVEDAPAPGEPAYCSTNRTHSWRINLSAAELRRLAPGAKGKAAAGATPMRLRVEVTQATASGHVRALALYEEPLPQAPASGPVAAATPDAGALALAPARTAPLRRVTGSEWRQLVGSARLKSMRFTVRSTEDGGAVVEGTGWGHGVGLCQFGAEGMARSSAGPGYQQILKHYYTGVDVAPLP